MDSITVTPAYGRDYNSKAAAIADWNAGKDFIVAGLDQAGRAVNKADALRAGVQRVTIRYKRLTMAVYINADGSQVR